MSPAGRSLAAVGLAACVAGGALFSLARDDGFPHAEHAGLFPTCLGCHAGVPEGDEGRYYTVTADGCASCHDGTRLERVEWRAPARRATNLTYDHASHAREVARAGDEPLACGACHAAEAEEGATPPRMAVEAARPASCLACHAHRAEAHLAASTPCAACHRPLAEAAELAVERVVAFPRPPDHEAPGFLSEHAASAEDGTCAVCHARQSCERCHLDARELPSVRSLPEDARVAALVAELPGEWPLPSSHERSDWVVAHGEPAAGGGEACATCHAAPSCAGCHGEATARVASRLSTPGPAGPRGAAVEVSGVPGHGPGFSEAHGTAAATGLPSCASCHVESDCASCHLRADAAAAWLPRGEPEFHPVNFVLRHGAEAFAARTECAECHSSEAFCRSCHESVGAAAVSRRTSGSFHDAQPDWLLGHGQAARQGMEACASCHRQSSCLRCHSARAGLRINPHGTGFDPDRVAERSTLSCSICHTAGQILPP